MTPYTFRSRAAILAALTGLALAGSACSTDPVSNLNGIKVGYTHDVYLERLGGVLWIEKFDAATRTNMFDSFARAAANFVVTDSRSITEWLGDGSDIEASTFYSTANWQFQFTSIRNAQALLTDLPKANPAYSPGDIAKWKGIIYTLEALSYMYAELTKDTLGTPVTAPLVSNPSLPAPILCSRDTWQFIVALLDSGLTQLNADPSAGLPVALDRGFAAVRAQASPSTTAGSFAAFNRALAARANLELAYAIARSPGGTPPTATSAGAPDANALNRADSALHATALYSTTIAPAVAGEFTDPLAVYNSFSGASGDIANPVQGIIPTYYLLNEAVAVIDPADKRLVKLMTNPSGTAATTFNAKASPLTFSMYPNATSPVPIIRNEELHLYGAQIRLGLNDLAGAVAEINQVRTQVGGLPPFVNPGTYVGVRNQILTEFMASTSGEPAGDRSAAIRDYGLPLVADTTWGARDTHATVEPFTSTDVTARNGNTKYICP